MEKISRRQRLDEEYLPLSTEDGQLLCNYGPSLITDIFKVQTIVDATLFFISGEYLRFTIGADDPEVTDVKFLNPRIPTFFAHLLPHASVARKPRKPRAPPKTAADGEKKRAPQRARKKCAFFRMVVNRRKRLPSEPETVVLLADVKLFHYTTHVCGLRNSQDAELVMRVLEQALTSAQARLDNPELLIEFANGNEVRRDFLQGNTKCCSMPLIISPGDVVMTNICGKFPNFLRLRATHKLLRENYPGVISCLTTMSKSNYLAVTLFEHEPFFPIRTRVEMMADGDGVVREVQEAQHDYLMLSKKGKSKTPKHTFFVHASGRFIQSSRNNLTSLLFTEICMILLHKVTEGMKPPVIVEDVEGATPEDGSDDDVVSELEFAG